MRAGVSPGTRSHLGESLGGVSLHSPPPAGEARPRRTPPLTDYEDMDPLSPPGPCRTVLPGRQAAPPAGKPGARCSQAASGLSLQDPGLRSGFLVLPATSYHVAQNLAHSFGPLEMFTG